MKVRGINPDTARTPSAAIRNLKGKGKAYPLAVAIDRPLYSHQCPLMLHSPGHLAFSIWYFMRRDCGVAQIGLDCCKLLTVGVQVSLATRIGPRHTLPGCVWGDYDSDSANAKAWEPAMSARRHVTAMVFVVGIALTAVPAVGPTSPAQAQSGALTARQSKALDDYNDALSRFKAILAERRRQIDAREPLPNLPGQALYLARVDVMSTFKDLTDALPSRIGRPNKYEVPPAYFDADIEPLIDEYRSLFDVMETPPANAQGSSTPFKDVADLGIAIARAKGLDARQADAAGRISLGLFFAETNGKQNVGNGRSNTYIGSFQTGPSEDRNGRKRWQAIKPSIASLDPKLIARDDKEETRIGSLDHRLNHWTAVRDGLMNAHADLFAQIPDIAKTLPDPIDQMKFFELIQIIPTATRAALKSGNLLQSGVSDPTVMKYLRNNSIFAYGRADRARTSASFREILDAMWLFNQKFARAQAEFERVRTR